MYKTPSKQQIKEAVKEGWSIEQAKRGYDIFDRGGTGMLEVLRIDSVYNNEILQDESVTDEDCAHEAEKAGFCKIIPMSELPKNFKDSFGSLRYFGWIDTPENRKAISAYCSIL